MERKIIVASHGHMASGLKSTVEFFAGDQIDLIALDAYIDGEPIETKLTDLFTSFSDQTEVIVFTDLLAGSVNQKVFPYRLREHTHIITGMNLPVVLAAVLHPSTDYLSPIEISRLVNESRNALVYVNDLNLKQGEEDE